MSNIAPSNSSPKPSAKSPKSPAKQAEVANLERIGKLEAEMLKGQQLLKAKLEATIASHLTFQTEMATELDELLAEFASEGED